MRKISFLVLTILVLSNCNGGSAVEDEYMELSSLSDVSASAWEGLAKKKIYFGHQSVGFNIMAGVEEVLKQNPQIGLQVAESAEPADLEEGYFCHSKIGENNKPVTKMDGLGQFMASGRGDGVDIAFIKLCFVDVMSDTDVEGLFERYQQTAARLKEAYPDTTFVHFTVPLRIRMKPSLKYFVRNKVTGWVAFADNAHNVARNRYNELLRSEFGGKEPIFDVAEVESTHPGGKREVYSIDGVKCYSLVPDYTDDGGHLNETGRQRVAEQLLIFLSKLS